MSSRSKQEAHRAAKRQDARETLVRGEQKRIVVWKPPEQVGGDALSFFALDSAELEVLWNSPEVDAAAFASFINEMFEDEEDLSVSDIQEHREMIQKMRDHFE